MQSKNVLILGATSAVAADVARIYAHRGHRLYLIARNAAKLDALASELEEAVVGIEAGDLNQLEHNEMRVARAFDALGTVDVVLVAHGLLGDQVRSESDLDHALEILETNFISPISLLIPIAQRLEQQSSGSIAVITSVAGERGRPRNYTYGSAKGGLTRYLQGMRSRFHGLPIQVLNVKLGPVDTPMTEGHNKHTLFGKTEPVARGICRALEGNRHVVYLTPIWGPIMGIVRILPEFIFQRFGFLSGR